MVVDSARVGILAERRLWDNRHTPVQFLRNQVYCLRRPVRHHHTVCTDAQSLCYHPLQRQRFRFRIVVNYIHPFSQMRLQCRVVGLLVDIGAEIHAHHSCLVAVYVVSVSLYHVVTLIVSVWASKAIPLCSINRLSAPMSASSRGVPTVSPSLSISHIQSAI